MKALLRFASVNPAGVEAAFWSEAYALLLRGCAGMTNGAALQEAGEFVVSNKLRPVGRDLLAMLCNQGRPEIVPPLLVVLERGADDMRSVAAELRRRAAQALIAITGQNYGENATNWEGWWEKNRDAKLRGPDTSGSSGGGTVALDRSRGDEWEEVKKGAKVLVLGAGTACKCGKGHDLDRIDHAAQKLGLQVVLVDKPAFERDDCRLEDVLAILANCTHIREHCICPDCKPSKNYSGDRLFKCECPTDRHEPYTYVLGEKGVKKIRRYVEGGGYLFAEDWCMEDFVERAFGEFVRHGSVRTADEEVPVAPAAGAMTHPYLRKLFFRGWRPKEGSGTVSEKELHEVLHTWKIDAETRTIKVVDPNRVVTLLTSPHLEKVAQGNDAVAVTFSVGTPDGRPPIATTGEIQLDRAKLAGGRVLYVLSHFGKQKSQEDEYSLQNLLINFLTEAYARKTAGGERRKKK